MPGKTGCDARWVEAGSIVVVTGLGDNGVISKDGFVFHESVVCALSARLTKRPTKLAATLGKEESFFSLIDPAMTLAV